MSKVSKDTASSTNDVGPVVDISDELDGYAVNFVTFRENVDATPLLKGLKDDRCQCPHWGYVITGRMTYRYADGEEIYAAGDAFYHPPGHVPVSVEPGTEMVQFSPAHELKETEEAMARNMQAMAAS